jgi:hypothetical protein
LESTVSERACCWTVRPGWCCYAYVCCLLFVYAHACARMRKK